MICRGALVLIAMLLAGCATTGPQGPVTGPVPDAVPLATAINSTRQAQGLRVLLVDPQLSAAATAHARDMAAKGYFSHTGADGSSALMRVRRAGYFACFLAENIAQGQRSADAVMSDWLNSEGHRRNLLSTAPVALGVGTGAGRTWVAVFARPC